MGECEEEPPPLLAVPTPPALPLTQALSQAVAVSKDTQEVFEAYSSVTWEERGEGVLWGPPLQKAHPAYALGVSLHLLPDIRESSLTSSQMSTPVEWGRNSPCPRGSPNQDED